MNIYTYTFCKFIHPKNEKMKRKKDTSSKSCDGVDKCEASYKF